MPLAPDRQTELQEDEEVLGSGEKTNRSRHGLTAKIMSVIAMAVLMAISSYSNSATAQVSTLRRSARAVRRACQHLHDEYLQMTNEHPQLVEPVYATDLETGLRVRIEGVPCSNLLRASEEIILLNGNHLIHESRIFVERKRREVAQIEAQPAVRETRQIAATSRARSRSIRTCLSRQQTAVADCVRRIFEDEFRRARLPRPDTSNYQSVVSEIHRLQNPTIQQTEERDTCIIDANDERDRCMLTVDDCRNILGGHLSCRGSTAGEEAYRNNIRDCQTSHARRLRNCVNSERR